jgi:hypothetical protein
MEAQQPAIRQDESAARPQRAGFSLGFGRPSSDGRVMLGGDIEIFQDRPRPDLASYGTQAFEAKDRRLTGTQFALICDRSLEPRITSIASYKNLRNPYAIKLIEAGIVHWPAEDRQMLVLVFDLPPGRKLMNPEDAAPMRIADDRIISGIVRPILYVLSDLSKLEMVHGAIVPENIFISGTHGVEEAVLGECLSSAPFMRHHAFYETAERGIAQPSGRGHGTSQNDLYALGMVVAMVARGINFTLSMTPEQITLDKLDQGTYSAFGSREKLPAPLSEFLRGVLNDDESQRWSLEDALRWIEGRHPGSKQTQMVVKATRPFIFKDEKYWDLRSLAFVFGMKGPEAVPEIEKDHFVLWVKRNFDDKDLEKRLQRLWDKEENTTTDKTVANACMALDPEGPIRYRGVSVMPHGFGTALASAMAKGNDVQPYAELIALQYLSAWIQQRFEDVEEATGLLGAFEKSRNFLSQKLPGYGIERVAYLLSKEAACMSPALSRYFVFSLGHLLLALDSLSRSSSKPENILDRHMIAFISVRESKMIDPYLGHIVSRDRNYQLIGTLRVLVAIQRRFQVGSVPGLGGWIISLLQPVLERYHDRDLRQEISKRLSTMPDQGNLSAILELVDSEGTTQNDMQRFIMARQEFSALLREALMIGSGLKKRKYYGIDAGRQTAMLVSSVIGTCCIVGFLILHFVGR